MRTLAAWFIFLALFSATVSVGADQQLFPAESPGPEGSYLTIHNLRPAHDLTVGSGARVGILDHSFEMDAHPGLYAGGSRFWPTTDLPEAGDGTYRGFWMAMTVREIAPEAAIFALDIPPEDDGARVDAIVQALDWAVAQDLDVVTYCGEALSATAREILDPALQRTVDAGVVVAFVGYPHPRNLLPGGFGPSAPGNLRGPDLNIFSDDCTSLLAGHFQALVEPDDDTVRRNRPFLAQPRTGSVTAGLVALVKSVDPDATPEEVKSILVETSRPMVFRGRRADRVPDAFRAVSRARGMKT